MHFNRSYKEDPTKHPGSLPGWPERGCIEEMIFELSLADIWDVSPESP